MLQYQTTIHRFRHGPHLLHHFGKRLERERLLAIGDGVCRIIMHFDDDAVGARRDAGFCNCRNVTGIAG